MKTSQIHFRDPFVLLDGDTYYLYGTRGANCWGEDIIIPAKHDCCLPERIIVIVKRLENGM